MWGQQNSTTVPKQPTVHDIIARLAAEDADQGRPCLLLDHSAPRHLLSLDEAHTVMQEHRACDRAVCPRTAAAFNVLVAAGKIRPHRGYGEL
ncbi:hypothetical protein [Nocardia neocaledoniensis]|uniref:hypothetical protein n=1 Tax=Nocardia neocaledoniensis TaxID=236511 RepID=UPI002454049D|nr:hypothetical protein [Nocardia neocaledoniensis]